MRPQCFTCGKFISVGKGETAKLKVKEEDTHAYLCKVCIPANLDRFKTYPWCESVEMV